MTNKEFKRFVETYLLPSLGEHFRLRENFVFIQPVDWFLRFILFETSAYLRDRFDVRVAVQPLFLPERDLLLNWGERLATWELTADNELAVGDQILAQLREDGLRHLTRIRTPLEFAQVYADYEYYPAAPAYALLIAGEVEPGARALEEAHREELALILEGMLGLKRLGETTSIRAALAESPDKAVALLRAWREASIRQLQLPLDSIGEV